MILVGNLTISLLKLKNRQKKGVEDVRLLFCLLFDILMHNCICGYAIIMTTNNIFFDTLMLKYNIPTLG